MRRIFVFIIITAMFCITIARAQTSAAQKNAAAKTGAGQPANAAKPDDKKDEDCGCEVKVPEGVAATVNSVKIAIKDVDEVDETSKARVQELQNQVIEARKQQVNLLINVKLLDAEAKKRGISSDKLLEIEVAAKLKEPTDAEAQAFFTQNRQQIQGEFNDVKPNIIAYLRGQRQAEGQRAFADRLRTGAAVKVMVANPTVAETTADRKRVLATVNTEPITAGDVEDSLQSLIFSVQDQVYAIRKVALDAKINDTLLEAEAKKRNITPQELFTQEVIPHIKLVTEADARKFYDENKERVKAPFEQMAAQIIDYLKEQEFQNAAGAYATQLRKGAVVQVYLKEPEPPVVNVAIDDQPMRGNPNASVTIVEFTDYQCPSCGKTQPILEEIAKEYGDKVRLVARDFPLDQHQFAEKAAEAAEAAREQGKYWEYAAILFKNQEALAVPNLKEYATQVGLDRTKFDAALDTGKFTDKVKRDLREGEKLGVSSTPTIFINGKRVRDKTREGLKSSIDAALKTAGQ
jgi:protein-disulfide isomerase